MNTTFEYKRRKFDVLGTFRGRRVVYIHVISGKASYCDFATSEKAEKSAKRQIDAEEAK